MNRLFAALCALALPLAACDVDPLGTDNGGNGGGNGGGAIEPPVKLAVTGHGPVTERFTAEVAATGPWAYTSTWSFRSAPGNAVKIWNVGSGTPQLVDSLIVPVSRNVGDVQISDDGRLLVIVTETSGQGAMVVYDRANPAKPVELATYSSDLIRAGFGVHTVKLGRVAGTLYAFLSVPSGSQVVIVSLADPANPVQVGLITQTTSFVHDVFVRDGLLFTAGWDEGMTIYDIGGGTRGGSPANPVRIGRALTAGGNVHNIWWFHDPSSGQKRYAFVGEEAGPFSVGVTSAGDLHVVDVSDMTNPREVAFLNVPNAGAHNFVMDEASGILYAAFYNGGVRALDVRGDLSSCTAQQKDSLGRCDLRLMGREVATGLTDIAGVSVWGVARVGNALYASDMASGIYRLDITPLVR